jgi:hypothetical protein
VGAAAALATMGILASIGFYLFLLMLVDPCGPALRGEVYDTRTYPLSGAEVRICAHREKGPPITGAIMVVEYRQDADSRWIEITADRFDDPIEVPKTVKSDGGRRIVVELYRKWVGTADGGRTWIAWDSGKLDPDLEARGFYRVSGFEPGLDGCGELRLFSHVRGQEAVLDTRDHGRSWRRVRIVPAEKK